MHDQAFAEGGSGRAASEALTRVAFNYVNEGGEGTPRVRVEDYVTVLAALTGESALVESGVIDIETAEGKPGSWIFGEAINQVLTGADPSSPSPSSDSVLGTLIQRLVPAFVQIDAFLPKERWYQHVASTVGSAPWGQVALSVPSENGPRIVPIRVAFELRDVVAKISSAPELGEVRRTEICTQALADALFEVEGVADSEVLLTLAIELLFGMSKMTPMSKNALREIAGQA